MQDLISQFKDHVIASATHPDFIHYKWFVKYHLLIVEKLALDLCSSYPSADKDLVLLLVWLHDLKKIANSDGQKDLELLGFPSDMVTKALAYVEIIDRKNPDELKTAPLEVQIISSADGGSHFIGPFFPIFMYENPDKDLEELLVLNLAKAKKDWDLKIVLPEIKALVKERHDFAVEQNGGTS